MKISYISDVHIDMWIHAYNTYGSWIEGPDGNKVHSSTCSNWYVVKQLIDNSKDLGEILIVAGDLGHKNKQNKEFLELISRHFKHTFVVLGNHDYYLINSEAYKYLRTSKLRVEEMESMIKEIPNVTLLKGQIEEYNGIKFQGNVGWCDGKYLKTLKSNIDPQKLYTEGDYLGPGQGWVRMNDCILIMPSHQYNMYYNVNNMQWQPGEVDVMITHHNPSILKGHQDPEYKNSLLTAFYCFDGRHLFKDKKPKLWVYGHSHRGRNYTYKGCKVVNNAMGYPHEENSQLFIKTINIDMIK